MKYDKKKADTLFEEWDEDLTKHRRSEGQVGKRHSPETLQKMSQAHQGKVKSLATRLRMSAAQKAIPRSPLSEHTKKLLSQKLTGFKHQTLHCPHCGVTGGETSLKRWHFENCIFKSAQIRARFEKAFREGPTASGNNKVSWQTTAKRHGIDGRRLLTYIEVVRPFLGKV